MYELGLTEGPITITPNIHYQNVLVNDYGPEVPADILFNLCECNIDMTLVHYDRNVLDACVLESMAGGKIVGGVLDTFGFRLKGAGTPLGGNIPLLASGCHYMGLNIQTNQMLSYPWEFPAVFLAQMPMQLPVGTKRSLPLCHWRSIPYNPSLTTTVTISGGTVLRTSGATGGSTTIRITTPDEIMSSGAVLINHALDT